MERIEVDGETKRMVAFAARMAGVTEGEIVRRSLAADTSVADEAGAEPEGRPIFADYEGHRTRALYFAPGRVEIIDGPLKGRTFKTPSGAARAVVRHYNQSVNDNRNGWSFWQLDQGGRHVWLQSIRPASNDV